MRLANLDGRAVLVAPDTTAAVDAGAASDRRFGPDLASVYESWVPFRGVGGHPGSVGRRNAHGHCSLGVAVAHPRQVFAMGLVVIIGRRVEGVAEADAWDHVAGLAVRQGGPVLLPGDVIFAGTPAGVGLGRTPQRFLVPGDEVRSWFEGIGEIEQTFVEEQP